MVRHLSVFSLLLTASGVLAGCSAGHPSSDAEASPTPSTAPTYSIEDVLAIVPVVADVDWAPIDRTDVDRTRTAVDILSNLADWYPAGSVSPTECQAYLYADNLVSDYDSGSSGSDQVVYFADFQPSVTTEADYGYAEVRAFASAGDATAFANFAEAGALTCSTGVTLTDETAVYWQSEAITVRKQDATGGGTLVIIEESGVEGTDSTGAIDPTVASGWNQVMLVQGNLVVNLHVVTNAGDPLTLEQGIALANAFSSQL